MKTVCSKRGDKPARQWFGLTLDQLEFDVSYVIEAGPKSGPFRVGNIAERFIAPVRGALGISQDTLQIYASDGGRLLTEVNLGDGPMAKRLNKLRFARRPPTEPELANARATQAAHRSFQRAWARREQESE